MLHIITQTWKFLYKYYFVYYTLIKYIILYYQSYENLIHLWYYMTWVYNENF